MRFLLVIIKQASLKTYHIPLGVGYISASLKQAGHEVRVLNPNHSHGDLKDQLIEAISDFNPDVLSVGGMSFHMREIRDVVVTARPLLPHGIIVVGGSVLSNHPEVTMNALPEADLGVAGEAEETVQELAEALISGSDLSGVKGLIYRDGAGNLVQTPPRAKVKDLDALPWIDWDGLGLDVYAGLHKTGQIAPGLIIDNNARLMPFLTSRGCPFACTFCIHEILGRQYRTRALDDVFDELEYAVDRYGINTVMFYDDVFCLKRQRLHDFCERVRPMGLRWECSLRVEQVTEDNLKLMHDAGCVSVGLGVESMNPDVLANMKKSTTKEALIKALDLIYASKMTTWGNLIYGDPAETTETAHESLEWWAENNHFDMRTAFIGFHPGSTIYEDAVKKGLISDPSAFLLQDSPVINGTRMTDKEFVTLKDKTVPQYVISFGYPGKILELTHKGDGFLYDLKCVCPHCNEELFYSDIELDPGVLNRISCKYCNQLHRIPVRFRNAGSAQVRQLQERLQTLLPRQSGQISVQNASEIVSVCKEINRLDIGCEQTRSIMLTIADGMGQEAAAVEVLETAIVSNPYNPDLFDQMDKRMAKLGRDKERKKYARQANLLRKLGVTAPLDIDLQTQRVSAPS